MLTRRSVVAAAAIAPFLAKTALAAETTDVVIVGAGLSGLNAAMILKQQGVRSIVLDANSQVGGRVRSHKTVDGSIDVGASEIGRGYARVLDACGKLGLELVSEDRDLLTFGMHYKDRWIEAKGWDANPLNACVGDERAIPPFLMGSALAAKYNPLVTLDDWLDPKFAASDISLRTLLRQKGHSPQAMELAALSAPGISIDDTSMLRMWQEETRSKFDARIGGATPPAKKDHPFGEANDHKVVNGLARISNIVGGCHCLPEAMAATLGDSIRLGKRVVGIAMTDAGGTVTCADGGAYKARFILSAIPFSLLRDVKIEAEPDPVHTQAITRMPYANTARMFLTVDRPFWLDDGLPPSFSTDGPMGMFWAVDNHQGAGAYKALIVLVGQTAQAVAGDDKSAETMLLDELARLRPASKGHVMVATYKDWQADPYQRGCGFSLAPGQVNGFARAMVQPWQVMHFAGEHTRRLDFGMEAAFESGERAALEILERAA